MDSKPTTTALLSPAAIRMLLATGAGALFGQIVLAMAAHHAGAPAGLGFALVFVLTGSVAVTLLLKHLHAQQRPRKAAPLTDWLVALGLALFFTLQLGGV